jgi:hypothetical protein
LAFFVVFRTVPSLWTTVPSLLNVSDQAGVENSKMVITNNFNIR